MVILSIIAESAAILMLAALWSACFVGWGRALLRLASLTPLTLAGHMASFWMGLAGVVLFAQAWHLALPINSTLAVFVLAAGFALLLADRRMLCKGIKRRNIVFSPLFLLYVGFALWAANRSVGAPLLQDSGDYHFPVLRWLAEFRAVPGLGNVDPALAPNQSYFLYAALLNAFPVKDWSFHYANATLVLVGLVLPARALVGILRRERETPPPLATFHTLCLVPYSLLIRSMYMSSPTPDLAIDVLEIILAGFVLELLYAPREHHPFYLFAIAILIPLGFALKLSFLVFGLPLAAVVLLRLLRSGGPWLSRRVIAVWFSFTVILAATWIANGVIESGYPFFPSKIAAMPVDWKVPDSLMHYYANAIHDEKGSHLPSTSWAYYQKWLTFNSKSHDFSLKFPFLMTCLGTLAAFLYLALGRLRRDSYWVADLLAGLLIGILIWFLTCPIDRFAIELLWLVPILLAVSLCPSEGELRRQGFVVSAFFLAAIFLIGIRVRPVTGAAPEWPNAIPAPALFEYRTASGLTVNVPIAGPPTSPTYVWNSPVPAARHPNYGLELRGRFLAEGFRIRADPHFDVSVTEAYAQMTTEIQSLERAITNNDTAAIDRGTDRIMQLCQVFNDHILAAIPPKSPILKDRLTDILYESLRLQGASHSENAAERLILFNRLKDLVSSLPDYYPSTALVRHGGPRGKSLPRPGS